MADADMPTRIDPDSVARQMSAGDALVGQTFSGRYQILSKLGQGGMGAVYRAQHLMLERPCAVKVLPVEVACNEEMVARFRQEARSTAQLDQENVVRIYDVDSEAGREYIAMELVCGQSMQELLVDREILPWREAVGLIRQAALGLQAAHEAGILHRDIKPANLMVTDKGVVKVMDFGLSRLVEGDNHLSRTGQVLGTPHFMSPEQAQAEPLDARADIYSLGATLYMLVSGATPFDGASLTALLIQLVQEKPRPVEQLNPDLPGPVAGVIRKMMARDPGQRYADMGQVVAACDALLAGGKPAVVGKGTPSGLRWAAVAGGLLLVVLLALWALRKSPDRVAFEALQQKLSGATMDAAEKVAACNGFLTDFPESAHKAEVEQLREDWRARIPRPVAEAKGPPPPAKMLENLGKALGGLKELEKLKELKKMGDAIRGIDLENLRPVEVARFRRLRAVVHLHVKNGRIDLARKAVREFIARERRPGSRRAAKEMLDALGED